MENLEELKKSPRTSHLAELYDKLAHEEEATRDMMKSDDSLFELGKEELATIRKQMNAIKLQIADIKKKEEQEEEFPSEIIMEIRAGAGGDEASLFALDLAEMYQAYFDKMDFDWKTMDESTSPAGGYKEVSMEAKGENIYKLLRYETGVHRIQRVPATEKMGRIHTSTASVAILPLRKKHKLEIKPSNLQI